MTTPTLATAKEYIDHLDLSYIIKSMCAESYPLPRWTEADALHCAKLYKYFMFLLKKYPNESLVPTRQIDEFWHNHILYTKKYIRDCDQIFGHYLHHAPTEPGDDPQELVNQYLRTKTLFLEEFAEKLP